jgi:hypothetical protein
MSVQTFTFAVYPTALDDSFDSFLMDVPTMNGADAAARRAWWSAFHILGPRGFEPEQFTVCEWVNNSPGRLVTMGGFTNLVHAS